MQRSLLFSSLLLATTAVGSGITAFANGDHTAETTSPTSATVASAPTGLRSAQNLVCYGDNVYMTTEQPSICFGINRDTAVDAVEWFCTEFKDYTFSADFTLAQSTWNYKASGPNQGATKQNIVDEGTINMTISLNRAQCDPVVLVGYNACIGQLKVPVDKCDTDAENGKHGGYIDVGCLHYEFQPNPIYWPRCMFENCLSKDTCTTGSIQSVGVTYASINPSAALTFSEPNGGGTLPKI